MSTNPGNRFRRTAWKITVIWRNNAHPNHFEYVKREDYEKKWAEVSDLMKPSRPDVQYAYACGGELDRDAPDLPPCGYVFRCHSQITRGFNTYPRNP